MENGEVCSLLSTVSTPNYAALLSYLIKNHFYFCNYCGRKFII
ncbi:MAG TPA: hypothetical protein VMT35_03835 [Ignavibacteriaceae bacterium]|nr:hypothetical protein [Ignavibacteriaceae bacterium]